MEAAVSGIVSMYAAREIPNRIIFKSHVREN